MTLFNGFEGPRIASPSEIIQGDQIFDEWARRWTCIYTTFHCGGNVKEMQFVRSGQRRFGLARVKRLYDDQVVAFQGGNRGREGRNP